MPIEKERAIAVIRMKTRTEWEGSVGSGKPTPKPRVFIFDAQLTAYIVHHTGLPGQPTRVRADWPIRNARGRVLPNTGSTNDPPPAPEWAFFSDDLPEANWEHPCRYIFVGGTPERPHINVTPDTLPPAVDKNAPLVEVAGIFES